MKKEKQIEARVLKGCTFDLVMASQPGGPKAAVMMRLVTQTPEGKLVQSAPVLLTPEEAVKLGQALQQNGQQALQTVGQTQGPVH